MTISQDPLGLLQKMQQATLATAPGLPEEIQAVEMWSGVGFRVDDARFVTPLDQVTEILLCPKMTMVPRTKSWLKGVANVRGNLLTIIDLPEFFGKESVFLDTKSRILVMNAPGLSAGLLVNEVYGLRHFNEEEEKQDITGLDDPMMANTRGAFLHDNVLWGVFDMHSLAESATFRHVAA